MPETPEELHRRAAGALRVPPVHEWDSWPFEGELRVRELRPPDPEPVITGAGLMSTREPTGLPEGMGRMRSSFAEIWDEVLPPTPREIWEDNLARVVRALGEGA